MLQAPNRTSKTIRPKIEMHRQGASSIVPLLLLHLIPSIFSLCCPPTTIQFQPDGYGCNVGGAYYQGGVCHIDVCGDGFMVVGKYCGYGSCNLFGCNCDGGCIAGSARDEFLWRHHVHLLNWYVHRNFLYSGQIYSWYRTERIHHGIILIGCCHLGEVNFNVNSISKQCSHYVCAWCANKSYSKKWNTAGQRVIILSHAFAFFGRPLAELFEAESREIRGSRIKTMVPNSLLFRNDFLAHQAHT